MLDRQIVHTKSCNTWERSRDVKDMMEANNRMDMLQKSRSGCLNLSWASSGFLSSENILLLFIPPA